MQGFDENRGENIAVGGRVDDVLCVIIAAYNEETYIGPCLKALLQQDNAAGPVAVIVAANACTDRTEEIVQAHKTDFEKRGWTQTLLSIEKPGKLNALNVADGVASGMAYIYLDADVACDPDLLGQLRHALDEENPVYATGTLRVARAKSWITRAYANLWTRLPFVQSGAVGAGLFAVNAAGRQRWGAFPEIISDDTFVRLQFTPEERIEVAARYHWPMVEGFRNLVRVRRRQDAGVIQVAHLFPELLRNEAKPTLSASEYLRLFKAAPVSFVIYGAVHLVVRLRSGGTEWSRGR